MPFLAQTQRYAVSQNQSPSVNLSVKNPWSVYVAMLLVMTICGGGCHPDPEIKSQPKSTQDGSPPKLTQVRDDSTSLLFIYKNERGQEERVISVSEVPQASRGQVRVVDLSLSPDQRKSRQFVQVFDLRTPAADGNYPGRVISRGAVEASLMKSLKPKAPPQKTQVQTQQPPITLYSASWCGYCKKARAFLKKRKLQFTEHDIEKNQNAARELARKAKRAGLQLGGVPVIDVGGRLMKGFDPKRLLSMVRQSRK